MRSTPGWSDTEREKRKREPDGGPTEWASHYLNSLQIADQKRDDGTGNGGRKEEALHPGCVNDPGDSNHSG